MACPRRAVVPIPWRWQFCPSPACPPGGWHVRQSFFISLFVVVGDDDDNDGFSLGVVKNGIEEVNLGESRDVVLGRWKKYVSNNANTKDEIFKNTNGHSPPMQLVILGNAAMEYIGKRVASGQQNQQQQ